MPINKDIKVKITSKGYSELVMSFINLQAKTNDMPWLKDDIDSMRNAIKKIEVSIKDNK